MTPSASAAYLHLLATRCLSVRPSAGAALRDDPVYIAEQMGHKDARFTFRVYQRAAKRREKLSGRYLEAFDSALVWARIGTKGDSEQDKSLQAAQPRRENRIGKPKMTHMRL